MTDTTEKISDTWCTPQDLFDILNKGGVYQGIEFDGFNFGIDLCASFDNFKLDVFFLDYLKNDFYIWGASNECYPKDYKDLIGDTVCFMNPPYSNPRPFIEKAWEDSKHCKIVCLVKVDPSTRWWSTFWNYSGYKCCTCQFIGLENDVCCEKCGSLGIKYYSGKKLGCDVIYFPKRIKFDPPKQLIDSGEVWKVGSNWVRRCGFYFIDSGQGGSGEKEWLWCRKDGWHCEKCKGKCYQTLSSPNFASCLVIMDRRGL